MYDVEFRFNSVDCRRTMPFIRRNGDVVDIEDGGENVVLEVNRVVLIERDGSWSVHCNCSTKRNWID